MKGISVESFLGKLEEIENGKNDYVVPAAKMEMVDDNALHIAGMDDFHLNDVSHSQVASKLDIPARFYKSIGAVPGLRTHNVNELMKYKDNSYTVRTVNDTARAFLSDKYLPVDNMAVMRQVMPLLRDFPESEIKTTTLTDSRMYMQILFPHTTREVVPGDAVQYGITLTNSEVGLGAVRVESTIWRLVCSNGLIGKSIVDRKHVGRRIGQDDNMDLFRRETIVADLKAFTMKLSDTIRYSLQEAQIEAMLQPMREAAGIPVEKPEETIQNITKKYGLNEAEGRNVLRNMFEEHNVSKWGIVNGITNSAHITESADRQYDLERIGADVLNLPRSQWEVLSA